MGCAWLWEWRLHFLFLHVKIGLEVESLDIHTPSLEEQNPQLYEDYLKDLNAFKASDHHVLFVSFSNVANPVKQGERLTALPDSVDYISLNNPSK